MTLAGALDAARARGWLGDSVLGSELAFDITIRVGAGSYVCGEETAMLESLEGKRGVVRAKPPLPTIEGLFGRPTIVNNVLTLATVPPIIAGGPVAYQAVGVGRSRGTQVFQLAGNVARGGAMELPFGVTIADARRRLWRWDTVRASGARRAGRRAAGRVPPADQLRPRDGLRGSLPRRMASLGHGGVVVFDDSVDLARQARFAMEFCAEESCGKCTPCRVGAVRGVEIMDRVHRGRRRAREPRATR